MRQHVAAALLVALVSTCSLQAVQSAVDDPFELTVVAGDRDYQYTPVRVPLRVGLTPPQMNAAILRDAQGREIVGQLTQPGLIEGSYVDDGTSSTLRVHRELHFVLPRLKAGSSLTLKVKLAAAPVKQESFSWHDTKGEHMDLRFGSRPVLRYMYKAYDDSTPEKRDRSYKVFHHLYDLAGKRFVSNGGHTSDGVTDPKKLLFPHHRGMQMGWNKCLYANGIRADTWHCQRDDHQSHEGILRSEAGMVLGRHRVAIDWHGAGKEVFAKEERQLTVYHLPGGTLVDFASRLKTTGGRVRLGGDPQHAGFQFRAHNDVAEKTKKETYYLRPDGQGKPGETRNWDPKTKKGPVNLPWDAMSFVTGGKRYTVCYLNHPKNPGESRWSERDYARFGCYFEYELSEDRPLVVNYRLWLQDGEMTGAQVQALSTSFVAPPKVTIK